MFELKADDVEPSPEGVLSAQQLAGELFWVAQRSRPDVAYASTLASSLSTRAPVRSARIAQRAFLYLRDTPEWTLRFMPAAANLTGYGDASFAPEGGRSHTGWAVLFRNCPIAWRSTRQTLTTLSTAEAEMVALQETALALIATQALLESLGIFPEDKLIYSDSTSAVAIQTGSCSFRTRHLKVRATWLTEQLQNGSMRLLHRPGALQLADLLTQALSGPRMRELAQLWSMLDSIASVPGLEPTPQVRRALVALVFLLSVHQGRAQQFEEEKLGIQSDFSLYLLGALVALSALALWEGIKALVGWFVLPRLNMLPSRRALRLRKLQEAAQRELELQLQAADNDSSVAQSSTQEETVGVSNAAANPIPIGRVSRSPVAPEVSRFPVACRVSSFQDDVRTQPEASQAQPHLDPVTSSRLTSQPRRRQAQGSRVQASLFRDAQVQTDGVEYPRFVVQERVRYPTSVIVTSGYSYHLSEHCPAVGRAAEQLPRGKRHFADTVWGAGLNQAISPMEFEKTFEPPDKHSL